MAKNRDIKIIIEEVISKKFKDQENSLLQILSGNAQIYNDKIDALFRKLEDVTSRILKIEKKQDELEKSLEFLHGNSIDQIEDVKKSLRNDLNEKIGNTENMILAHNERLKEIKEKLRKSEDRNRRNNLRIDGIEENEKEQWEITEQKVHKLLYEKLKLNNVVIERAHRMGKLDKEKPRTVIFKLLNYKDKERILKQSKLLKNTGIYINEDFSDETMLIRKELRTEMKKARADGMYSVIVYDQLVTRNFKRK